MGRKRRAKAGCRRNVLRLPDLDHSKSAVLNSLASPGSRRAYQFAIEEFIAWYCSEPRLAFTLLGCGLRRSELVGLEVENIQLRQDHWVATMA
jgi:integrase